MATPTDYPYIVRPENRCYGKITQHSIPNRMTEIKKGLNDEYLGKFKHSCFGNFLALTKIRFSGTTVHQMILHLVETKKNQELWFKVDGNLTRFGLEEFVLLTGLKTGVRPLGCSYDKVVERQQFYNRVFGSRSEVKFSDLEDAFFNTTDMADKYRVALLYCLEGVIAPSDRNNTISKEFIVLTQDEDLFNSYPWGTRAYELLVQSVKGKNWDIRFRGTCDDEGGKGVDTYHIYSFPMAIQIWAYETIPQVGQQFMTKSTNNYPRMVRWRGTKYVRSDVMDLFFKHNRLRIFTTLQPDETEKEKDYYKEMVKSTDDVPDQFLDELVVRAVNIQLPHEDNESDENDNNDNVHVVGDGGQYRRLTKRMRDDSAILEAIGAFAKKMVKVEAVCREGFRKLNIEIDDSASEHRVQTRGRNYTDDRTFEDLLNYNKGVSSSKQPNGPQPQASEEQEDGYEEFSDENDEELGAGPEKNDAIGLENDNGVEPEDESEERAEDGDESDDKTEDRATGDENSNIVNFPSDFLSAVDAKRGREYSRWRRRSDDSASVAVGPYSVTLKTVKDIEAGKTEWTPLDMNLAMWTLRNEDEKARETFRPNVGVMDYEFIDALFNSRRSSHSAWGKSKGIDPRISKFVNGSMYAEGRPIVEMDSLIFPVHVKGSRWVLVHADLVNWRAHALDCHTSSMAERELSGICAPYLKMIAEIVEDFNLRSKRPDYRLGIDRMVPGNAPLFNRYGGDTIPQANTTFYSGVMCYKFAECLLCGCPLTLITSSDVPKYLKKLATDISSQQLKYVL